MITARRKYYGVTNDLNEIPKVYTADKETVRESFMSRKNSAEDTRPCYLVEISVAMELLEEMNKGGEVIDHTNLIYEQWLDECGEKRCSTDYKRLLGEIEAIKLEIVGLVEKRSGFPYWYRRGFDDVWNIIDKHIGGINNGNNN